MIVEGDVGLLAACALWAFIIICWLIAEILDD